jgi:hypothetical protein
LYLSILILQVLFGLIALTCMVVLAQAEEEKEDLATAEQYYGGYGGRGYGK